MLDSRCKDPLFTLATPLRPHEWDTFSTKCIDMSVSPHATDQPFKTEFEDNEHHNNGNNEENNKCHGEMEKDVLLSAKRPGWFGKGYAKNKKARKRRRVR